MSLVLRGIPHNYLERPESGRFRAVPAYVRRAQDFIRANAAVPIRMEQVAAAAGCSIRTLDAVFRRFRDATPLSALHAIRLEQARAERSRSAKRASVAEIALLRLHKCRAHRGRLPPPPWRVTRGDGEPPLALIKGQASAPISNGARPEAESPLSIEGSRLELWAMGDRLRRNCRISPTS
jgi:AraC-like DNA-binding protein